MGLKDRLQLWLVVGVVVGLVFDLFTNTSPWAGVRLAGNIAFFLGVALLLTAFYREKKYREWKRERDAEAEAEADDGADEVGDA